MTWFRSEVDNEAMVCTLTFVAAWMSSQCERNPTASAIKRGFLKFRPRAGNLRFSFRPYLGTYKQNLKTALEKCQNPGSLVLCLVSVFCVFFRK